MGVRVLGFEVGTRDFSSETPIKFPGGDFKRAAKRAKSLMPNPTTSTLANQNVWEDRRGRDGKTEGDAVPGLVAAFPFIP